MGKRLQARCSLEVRAERRQNSLLYHWRASPAGFCAIRAWQLLLRQSMFSMPAALGACLSFPAQPRQVPNFLKQYKFERYTLFGKIFQLINPSFS